MIVMKYQYQKSGITQMLIELVIVIRPMILNEESACMI